MRRFFTLASLSMQQSLYYRNAFLGSMVQPFLLLAGQIILWTALFNFAPGTSVGGFDRATMYTYLVLSFPINNLLTWRSENQISRKIITGEIVSDCVRPMSFIAQNIAALMGSAFLQGGFNISFTIGILLVFSKHLVASTPTGVLLACVSLLFAVLLRLLMISTFSLLCFFTTSHVGITWTRIAITDFFSGALIPVVLFPTWLSAISYSTPFPYMLHLPIMLYLGQPMPMPLPWLFLVQAVWVFLFLLFQNMIWRKIRRNIIIAGG